MIVPSDLRDLVGKREIREFLRTTSWSEARLRCSAKQVEWNDRFEQMRTTAAEVATEDGVRLVDRHFDAQIATYGTYHAFAYELEMIA